MHKQVRVFHATFFFCVLTQVERKSDEEDTGSDDQEINDEDYYAGYDEEESEGSVNVGKEFLVPRAKTPAYDMDIFGPELLASRDKVSALDLELEGCFQYSSIIVEALTCTVSPTLVQ